MNHLLRPHLPPTLLHLLDDGNHESENARDHHPDHPEQYPIDLRMMITCLVELMLNYS